MCVFVGLESFNPAALADMHKYQNAAHKTRAAIDTCREHGILVISGLMLSPQIDTIDYIHSLPRRVRESGLHVPTFLCFESPIPGTPHFNRLAAEPGAFLPDALLRDFTGYTLVTRPHHASVDDFVGAYRGACREIFSTASRLRKLVEDVPYFLRARRPGCAIVDAADMIGLQGTFTHAGREHAIEIFKVYPEVSNGEFDVDLRFVGEKPEVRRGQTFQVRLQLSEDLQAVMLPRGPFFQDTGGQWVYVVDAAGTATKREVKLGRQNPDMYEVLEGLQPGDRVVTSRYSAFNNADELLIE